MCLGAHLASFPCTSPSAMHPLPASHPFPVAGVALGWTHDLGGLLALAMGDQGCKDGGDVGEGFLTFFRLIHREPLLDETGVELSGDEAMRVQDVLMKRDVGLHAQDAILLQSTAHAQDGFAARLAPAD